MRCAARAGHGARSCGRRKSYCSHQSVCVLPKHVSPSPERASEGDSSSNSQIRRIRYSVELEDQMVYSSLSTHNATEVVNDEVDALYIDNLCIKCRSPDCHGWPGCCNLCTARQDMARSCTRCITSDCISMQYRTISTNLCCHFAVYQKKQDQHMHA